MHSVTTSIRAGERSDRLSASPRRDSRALITLQDLRKASKSIARRCHFAFAALYSRTTAREVDSTQHQLPIMTASNGLHTDGVPLMLARPSILLGLLRHQRPFHRLCFSGYLLLLLLIIISGHLPSLGDKLLLGELVQLLVLLDQALLRGFGLTWVGL